MNSTREGRLAFGNSQYQPAASPDPRHAGVAVWLWQRRSDSSRNTPINQSSWGVTDVSFVVGKCVAPR